MRIAGRTELPVERNPTRRAQPDLTLQLNGRRDRQISDSCIPDITIHDVRRWYRRAGSERCRLVNVGGADGAGCGSDVVVESGYERPPRCLIETAVSFRP